jgi:hypothetical protein
MANAGFKKDVAIRPRKKGFSAEMVKGDAVSGGFLLI